MLAFVSSQDRPFDPDRDEIGVRQAFVELSNFTWYPDWRFWAGQRYYRRHDIHINGYFFWDMTGYGGGIEDIGILGDVKLALAYLGGAHQDFVVPDGRIAKHNLDIRFYDIPAPCGTSTVWINLATSPGGPLSDGSGIVPATQGCAVGYVHIAEQVFGGLNKFSVMYGTGAASNFSTEVPEPTPELPDSSQFLVTETLTMQPNDWFAMQATSITRITEDGSDPGGRITWVSGGMRPIVFLTEYTALAFEYGVDWVDNEPENRRGALQKFTFAPQLTSTNNFFARPNLRAFVTYAVWPESLKGAVGGPTYALATDGWSMGCQMEAWW